MGFLERSDSFIDSRRDSPVDNRTTSQVSDADKSSWFVKILAGTGIAGTKEAMWISRESQLSLLGRGPI